jgi:hypothetical protein
MTQQEWIKKFHCTKHHFRWFIDQYFPGKFDELESQVINLNIVKARSIMNQIWYDLPDSKFNIIENPNGWGEFLYLIDE